MFEWIASPEAWIALGTLVVLEIVLGIDNIIFISILVGRLPPEKRQLGRQFGLGLAMLTRLLLLASIAWVIGLTEPWFTLFGYTVSGRDFVLIAGGLFLLGKSTHEIHNSLEVVVNEHAEHTGSGKSGFISIIVQIAILDIVFSLDSVITAVGLVEHLSIMVIAVIASVGVMLIAAKPIGDYIDANPTLKMLALSFLILIGVTLIAEGMGYHVPRGYIYFSMAFSVTVEFLNIRLRKKEHGKSIKLNKLHISE
jgi:predicted tellurium resistance membrane protein TerC